MPKVIQPTIRNYSYDDFSVESLKRLKDEKGLSIGVALPVLNEGRTLEGLIDNLRGSVGGLIDTLQVFDSGSTDSSEEICLRMGVPFIKDVDVAKDLNLPEGSWKSGKGFNLWASTHYLSNHDILSWIDADITEFNPRFIYGILGPMIQDDEIVFSKGRYGRPESDNKVTRILAEPFMSLLFPETREFADPLCGLYGGKTDFLRKLPFYTGYSVEVATLIGAINSTEPEKIAQVYVGDLKNREHDNKHLGVMSGNIAYTLLELAEEYGRLTRDDNRKYESIVQSNGNGSEMFLTKVNVREFRLPPTSKVSKVVIAS